MKKKKWNLSSEDCITNRKLALETSFLLKWTSSDKQYIKKNRNVSYYFFYENVKRRVKCIILFSIYG